MTTIALNLLRPGSEIGIDSRLTAREEGVDALAESIAANGLLAPLGVWVDPESDLIYVAFGNRRLAALRKLAAEEKLIEGWNFEVPIVIQEGELADMLTRSMVENVDRAELGDVDQFEAFAGLARLGKSIPEIAYQFRVDDKTVRRYLALGWLHPDILEALRAGVIDMPVAQAFTQLRDPVGQKAIFEDLRKNQSLYRRAVVERIQGEPHRNGKYLTLVGAEAYAEAGGRSVHDLFDDSVVILDPAILAALAAQRLATTAAEVKAEGWAEVYTEDDRPSDWYTWEDVGEEAFTPEEQVRYDHLLAWRQNGLDYDEAWTERSALMETVRARGITEEDRAASFALISLSHDGKISVTRGKRRKEGKAAPAEPGVPKVAAEPQSLIDELRVGMTRALADAVSTSFQRAMNLFLATMVIGPHRGSPLRINGHGHGEGYVTESLSGTGIFRGAGADLDQAIRIIANLTDDRKHDLFAAIIAETVDVTTAVRGGSAGLEKVNADGAQSMALWLEQETILAAIRHHFDVEAYFIRAPGAFALTAIREIEGEEEAARWRGQKKGEIAAKATFYARRVGWLPNELRVMGYRLTSEDAPAEPIKEAKPKRSRKPAKA